VSSQRFVSSLLLIHFAKFNFLMIFFNLKGPKGITGLQGLPGPYGKKFTFRLFQKKCHYPYLTVVQNRFV
jgi:hypothetical protein